MDVVVGHHGLAMRDEEFIEFVCGSIDLRTTAMDVRIQLESCSPPTGEVRSARCATAEGFVGWLDLLRVLATMFEDEAHADSRGWP